jgi:hypothetical protein
VFARTVKTLSQTVLLCSSVLSNLTGIFSDSRVCVTTLALRFLYAMFDSHNAHQLVLKQMAVVRVPQRMPVPPAVASRVAVLVYSVDLCALRVKEGRTLQTEAKELQDIVAAGIKSASRVLVLLLITNVVQFCIDVERSLANYHGLSSYSGTPGCAISLYRYIEQYLVKSVPAHVPLHVATPKANSRFDFSQARAIARARVCVCVCLYSALTHSLCVCSALHR